VDTPCTLPRPLLSGLSDFVATRLGLHFPEERWRDLQRGLVAAASEFGFEDAESCARWLLSAALERNHIEVLASHLTVGETYFFREKSSLDVFREHIVPALLRLRRDGERRLRIWSAGCCTGEEPYSIAMLLDSLIPNPMAWNVTILATDINPSFLRKAAAGIYSEWSFRGTPEWVKERYFKKRKDGRLELHPHIRARVTFSYLNLADDVYPSLLSNTNAMDVIFCRNVLMYFNAERVKRVSGNFHRSLVDGGWLIVSPTETSNTLFSSFMPVEFPDAVIYRKLEAAKRPIVVKPLVFASEPDGEATVTSEPGLAAVLEPIEMPALYRDAGEEACLTARRCANQGRLMEAMEWCERAIAADKLNPAHYYLLASIEQEQGHAEAAVCSLRRALYLDSGFVLAQFALANIELSQGRRREGERHFANTLAMLRTHAHDEILPESEGLTAGRLIEIITSVLASLPRE